jgi:hypothetical protein
VTRASALLVLLLTACDGRELSVFELPAKIQPGGAGGLAGASSANTSGGTAGAMLPTSGGGGSAADVVGGGAGGGGGSYGGFMAPSGGMPGAAGAASPAPCGVDLDCSPGWICEKSGCDAPTGGCVPWPPFCPPDPNPVCGCDGVTYWNDCIRQQSPMHAQVAQPGVCSVTACACEVGADCSVPYASCSHLMGPGEMCGHGMGSCWVLPPQCGPSNDSKMWRECKPPDAGTAKCLDTCSAIATEHSYAELHRGDTCN